MRKRGRNKRRGNKRGQKREATQANEDQLNFWTTFKELNEPMLSPHDYFKDHESYYKFPIISKKFITSFESFIEGKSEELINLEDVNEDIVDNTVEEGMKFYWKNRENCNCFIKRKCKFKKDYYGITEAAWEWVLGWYPKSSFLVKKFSLERKGFFPVYGDLEVVSFFFVIYDI